MSALTPGLYVADATEPDYGLLDAMVALGDARFVGERYTAEGVKQIAVEVGGGHRPNQQRGAIRIGREFFTTALRDYEDWQEKWWREAIQNSVDARATEIECAIIEQPDGTFEVSSADNGGGMDEDTLINKFLVLGGTTKVVGGTTGGFGKAKELLVLPWIRWQIETRDLRVIGEGVEYSVERGVPSISGTRLSVIMPSDQTTTVAAALAFIGKCYLPGVTFRVRGSGEETSARADLAVGELLRSFAGKADLFHSKQSSFAQRLLVRANGLFMFDNYVSSGVEGQLIVELTAPSIEVLTANRDGFRDSELRYEMQQFINQLAADTKSALRKKQGLVREKFRGKGKFTTRERQREIASIAESVGALRPIDVYRDRTGRQVRELSDDQVERAVQEIVRFVGPGVPEAAAEPEPSYGYVAPTEFVAGRPEEREAAEPTGAPSFVATGDLARAMLSGIAMNGATHVEAAIQQLAWEPDFFLVNEVEGFRVPKRFYPESMAPNIRKLARFWAEMCRFVLIQLGSSETFGVGFVFDTSTGAEFIHEDEENWLLVNPLVEPSGLYGATGKEKLAIFSLGNPDHVAWLYAAAVHEATHMADGISYHDESFAAAMTRNVAKTSGKQKQIRAIRRLVVARRS